MSTDTGGPAFPLPYESNDVLPFYRGMTLRDYFAAKAMQQIMLRVVEDPRVLSRVAFDVANVSYEMADAMLKAREQ